MDFNEIIKKAKEKWQNLNQENKIIVNIGEATCGLAAGADAVDKIFRKQIKLHKVNAIIHKVGCIGACFAEPLVEIKKPGFPSIFYDQVTLEKAEEIFHDFIIKNNPRADLAFGKVGQKEIKGIRNLWDLDFFRHQIRIILKNCGIIDPEKIDEYIANGGYIAIQNALKMKPQEIIDEIKKSG